MREFDLRDWYWYVGDDRRVWSSKSAHDGGSFAAGFVQNDHAGFQAFLADGNSPSVNSSNQTMRQSIKTLPGAPGYIPGLGGYISGEEFLDRVTDQEMRRIKNAAANNDQLDRFIEILRVRGEIDTQGPRAQTAKAALVTAGLLTQQRADIIFA